MSTSLHDVPGGFQEQYAAALHAAATATETRGIWRAPYAAKIRAVEIVFDAAITGANTDYTDLSVINMGTDGTGTTVLGAATSYQSGTNAAAGATVSLYAPTTPLAVAAGTKLGLKWTKTGNGLLIPAGVVYVTYEGG